MNVVWGCVIGAVASLICMPAGAQAPGRRGEYGPPAEGPFLRELLAQRLRADPHASPLPDDAALERQFLADPASLYPTVHSSDVGEADASWSRALSAMSKAGIPMTLPQARASYRWDLGLTRAQPGRDVPRVEETSRFRRDWAVANMVKAGVDLDIFLKARDLVPGTDDAAIAAPLAVAAQLLREQQRDMRAGGDPYVGSWQAPLDRFMSAATLDGLGEEHLPYLMRLLENELSSWRERPASGYGLRQVPTAVRVARTAAAYRARDYDSFPCLETGEVNQGIASDVPDDADRPLCFAAMTDRGVLRWYMAHLFEVEAVRKANADIATPAMRRLSGAVSRVQPGWIGVFERTTQGAALDTHVVTAGLAQELLKRGAISSEIKATLDEIAIDQVCHGVAW